MTGRLQEKNGRYYMILNLKDKRGRYKNKWIKTGLPVKGNHDKALRMLKEKIKEYEDQNLIWSPNRDFVEYIRLWLRVKRITIQESTYLSYLTTLEAHIKSYFASKKLESLQTIDFQNYYLDKLDSGLSPCTVIKHHAVLNGALEYAVDQGLIPVNPIRRVTLPRKQECVVQFFTNDQLEKILDAAKGHPIEAAIYIAIYCGFRRSEVLGVKWSAVDFDNNIIVMNHTVINCGNKIVYKNSGKGKSSIRTIKLPKPLKKYLQKLYAQQAQQKAILKTTCYQNDYICKRVDGTLFRPDYITESFKKLLMDNDLPAYHFHTLRHSSATFLLSKGYQLIDIQGWLGHKRLESTAIYAHLQYHAIERMADAFDDLHP